MPAAYARLMRNLRGNQLSNVEAHDLATGASSGRSKFYFFPQTALPPSSSLAASFAQFAGVRECEVGVTSLDDFIRQQSIARVDLIKIDTETTEPEVLRGARELLARDRPHIICEVLAGKNTARQLEQSLAGLSYNYFLLSAEGPQLRRTIEGDPEHLNYLFTTLDASTLASRLSHWNHRDA